MVQITCTLSDSSSQSVNGHSRKLLIAKDVDFHLILTLVLVHIIVFVPYKMNEVAMMFTHQETMENLLIVYYQRHSRTPTRELLRSRPVRSMLLRQTPEYQAMESKTTLI